MKAILVRELGGPDVLKLEEVPTPKPAAGEVLVRIHAAGVNPYDTYMRAGSRARPRCGSHARAVHHGRSRARHARGDQGLSVELRSAPFGSDRRSCRDRGSCKGLPGLFQKGPTR